MPKTKLFVVPHTHYDAEVFLTRDATLKWGAEHILDALYLLDTDPDYRFVLDQRCYVEGFAVLHPEQMERLKAHVASGRMEIAGGMHAMLDANLPCGESFVRQILYGQAYFEHMFDVRSTTGWMIDCFGHHPQVPQLMSKAGFDSYVFGRGMPVHDYAGFNWVGLDGSKLRCEWLPYHYGVLGLTPNTLPEFRQAIDTLVNDAMAKYVYNNQIVALAGLDLHAPNPALPELIHQYNAAQDQIEVVLATAHEYLQAQALSSPIEAGVGLPEIGGDFNPLFTGCYAARILLKQRNRELENKLFSVEKLMAVNWAQAGVKDAVVESLEAAWEPVLFNQFHDLICGSHVDASYERACDRHKRAAKLASLATERALDALIGMIDTRGHGIPLVVVNLLAHPRRDVGRCTVGFSGERWHALALYDADGDQVPLQLENVLRHPDGSIKRAELIFIADVPSFGYRTYFVRQGGGAQPKTDVTVKRINTSPTPGLNLCPTDPDDGQMSNGLIELRASLRTGAITSLILRAANWDVVAQHEHAFASLCRQEDRGDPWEYYGPLRGGILGAYNVLDPIPSRGQAAFSYQYGGQGWAGGGPVMAEMRVQGPFGDGQLATHIRLYSGLPRVEITTELVNQQPFVRYRNVFPLHLNDPHITYEIPFGAVERPQGEFPAQNWVDVSDRQRGVALLNRGIPGHALNGNVLTSSLMKCAQIVSYSGGGYSKEARDSAGLEIGVRHCFEQALLPHLGDWRSAQLYHEGMAFNVPLVVQKCLPHAGASPSNGTFASIEPANLVLHAMYVEKRQLVMRVAEAAGDAVNGKIRLRWAINAAHETNLVGGSARPLQTTHSGFTFSATPFEIKTFRIDLP